MNVLLKPAAIALLTLMSGVAADLKASQADEQSIREILSKLATTWNVHDMKTHCAFMAEDADFINVNGWWWQGREEIQRHHLRAHETVFKKSEAVISPKKIRFLKADVAVIQASWRVSGDTRAANARDYIMTYVMQKQNGRWLIIAAQNASAEDRSSASPVNLSTPASFGGPNEKTTARPSEEYVAIQATLTRSDQAWEKGDMEVAAQLYTPDADVVDRKALWLQGRDQIERHLKSLRSGALSKAHRTSKVAKVRLVYPDLAVVNQRWHMTTESDGQAPINGMGLLVLVRSGSEWKIVAAENTVTRAGSGLPTRN